jgi:hypothetical protein
MPVVVSIGENDGFSIGLVYTTINLAMSGREDAKDSTIYLRFRNNNTYCNNTH